MMHALHVGQNPDVFHPGGLALTARAIDLCSFRIGARVVDIGCGTGVSVDYLCHELGLAAIGIDLDIMLLKRGTQRNPALPLVRGKAEALPFASASLDGVLAECSLSVVTDKDRALAEFNRALRRGSRLVVSDVYAQDPRAINSINDVSFPFCMSGMMTKESLTDSLSRNGFSIEIWEDHSNVLKEFIIQLIMEHGSLQNFCGRNGAQDADIMTLKQACPGYFLMVARKDT